jgi:uncharacterized protein DUF4367
VLVMVGAATFLAWRNVPQVSMRVASMRASIKGSVPAYIPSGFKFAGPIKYESGSVSMTFKAAEDGKTFTITQQASKWDSSSLKANAVPANSQVQTALVKGTTVYIYGSKNNAAWVNNGIRYTIQGNAELNSDQLSKIADSLQ